MRLSLGHLSVSAVVLCVALGTDLATRSANGSVRADVESDESVAFRRRVGDYAQRYYGRAQHVMALEKVTLQTLAGDLSPIGLPMRFEYELRVEWRPGDPGAGDAATAVRTLLKVNGRAPRPGDGAQCLPAVSPEPLAMLLPAKQTEFSFSLGRPAKVDGRAVRVLSYRSSRAPGPPEVTWTKSCFTFDMPGRSAGRVWADAVSGEVLRLEDRMVGSLEVPVPIEQRATPSADRMTVERAEITIRYKPFVFRDPDETLMLPSVIETVSVTRDAAVRRGRMTQSLSNYRRFVTGARVVD